MKSILAIIVLVAWLSPTEATSREKHARRTVSADLPTVDLSSDAARQTIVARGDEKTFHGQPTTLLLQGGKTIFCAWSVDHGGLCGPLKRSDDGGLSWSEMLPVPENWHDVRRCPSLYRLIGPDGVARLFVFAGQGPDETMHQSYSLDEGKTWTPMESNGLVCVMPFTTIVPADGGKTLVAMSNIRRPGEIKEDRSNVIAQSRSTDGGLNWSSWQVVHDLPGLKPCEPQIVVSPDSRQWLCLMRENVRQVSLYSVSNDEGRTWSKPQPLPTGLHGDRHVARFADDGRLVVCFRDTGKQSSSRDHVVAWVGRYDDILAGRLGQYRIKLLHSHDGDDCGYCGLELLPDETFVATTYGKYRLGPEKQSIVSVRFKLSETDGLLKVETAR
jgi:hypothetical protein